jgi:hypothetical protein
MMNRIQQACLLATISAAAGALVFAADTKLTSTWKAPEAAGVSYVGKKVAAVIITKDDSLRVSAEEWLAEELTARGVLGVATYRIIPREETESAEKAKVWLERANVEGAVTMRLVTSDTERTYSPVVWSSGYYPSFWGYYGYGWTTVVDLGGGLRTDTRVVVETLVYSVPKNALLWAGVSETKNPKDARTFMKDLVTAVVKEMQKEGLAKR